MRFAIAVLILAVTLPSAEAAGKGNPKHQCQTQCDSGYQLCKNRSTTKLARKGCKINRKSCRSVCR